MRLWIGTIALVCVLHAGSARAQTPRFDPAGIPGAVLLSDQQISDSALEKFMDLAGGANAKVVVVPIDKQAPTLLKRLEEIAAKKKAAKPREVFFKDVKAELPQATGVWITELSKRIDDQPTPLQQTLAAHPPGDAFADLLKRSGVIGSDGGIDPLGVLPGDFHDHRAARTSIKKKAFVPIGYVWLDLDRGAALLIKGRTLSAVGPGTVKLMLWRSDSLPIRKITLEGKSQEDLTALRRAARDRMQSFPPKKVEDPVVAKGTLVIVGGGGSPVGMYKQFVDYAGGPDKAKIVIFPTAIPDPIPNRDSVAETFKKAGAKKATILKGRTLKEVESKEYLDALKEATGLWFDGGRQWRFVDAYENTKALPLMHDVLERGGVIGGTSAGATIQGDYLARGGVFNNFDIRYEGYERGLGFLKGVAIDQHFTQRKRQADMTSLMKTYPQYLGIGIDEATALVVKGSTADVIGKGKVHFYDANRKVEHGQPDYEALSTGGRYDLKARKVLGATPDK